MPGSLRIETPEPFIRVLTLEHAGKKNALDEAMLLALEQALHDAADVRVWLLRGDGGAFCSGYDLNALGSLERTSPLPDERIGVVFDALMHHPAPSVALVRGPAFGAGCELSMACDFRVADESAVFCLPPAKLGVVYARKGLERVARRVGEQTARLMFLTGRRLTAQDALARGVVDVLAADAEAAAFSLCRELAANAPLAVQGMKRGLALEPNASAPVLAAYEAERRRSFHSDDAQEGRAAILEKRAPRFSGR